MSLLEGVRALDTHVLGLTLVHFLWQGILACWPSPTWWRVRARPASGTQWRPARSWSWWALPVVTFVGMRSGLAVEPAAIDLGPTGPG